MLKTQKTTIMKQNEATIRESSALSLIISSIIIVIVVGVQYYMGVQQDVEDAKKLVKRDLQIVEMQIMSIFLDAEFSMDEMLGEVLDTIGEQGYLTFNRTRVLGVLAKLGENLHLLC